MILPEIVVDVTPGHFLFRSKDQQHSVNTYIGLIFENDTPRIVSIGRKADIPDAIIVHLFEADDKNPVLEMLDKFDLFTEFMEYGISKTFERVRRPVPRHSIIFRSAKNLQPFFRGYQNFLLEAVALACGAREVKFE
jgi:hypothetical protein